MCIRDSGSGLRGFPDHGGRQGGGRGDPDDLRRPQYQYRYAEQPYRRVYDCLLYTSITLENLSPVVTPEQEAAKRRELEQQLYEVFRKYADKRQSEEAGA